MHCLRPHAPATPVSLPEPTRRPTPGQLTFAAPRRGKPPRHLADLDPAERKAAVEALGQKGFRAKQLSTHYFERLVEAPEDMTDLPKAIRDELVAGLLPQLMTPVRTRTADDGATIKSVWRLHDGALVESVLMRYPGRVTICVSSQAGCGMNCPFCATGQAGLTRNMSTAEIVEQVVARARSLRRGELAGGPEDRRCGSATWSSWAWARRWPTTRPPSARSGGSPTRPPTGWACRPAASPCRRSAWSRRSTSWPPRGCRSRSRCRCTPPTTSCATSWCRSTPAGRSTRRSTPPTATTRPPAAGSASSTP